VNGEQYVAVLAGRGGVLPLVAGEASKPIPFPNIGRMLAFKIGGSASLPPVQEVQQPPLDPPPSTASAATTSKGKALYQHFCSSCHGDVAVSGGVLPDLRYSSTLRTDQWFDIVLGGTLRQNGMVSFSKELSRQDATAIRAYVIFRANEGLKEASAAKETK
jgi:quinohemoprotein ethanol dehydrogenase